jgi:hypothetical protein
MVSIFPSCETVTREVDTGLPAFFPVLSSTLLLARRTVIVSAI